MTQPTLSTHVLDTSLGQPAAGVDIVLKPFQGSNIIATATTNSDGRVSQWSAPLDLAKGAYTLSFYIAEYFAAQGKDCFYPLAEIHFSLSGKPEHYHVPLVVSPYGYSTYRGS